MFYIDKVSSSIKNFFFLYAVRVRVWRFVLVEYVLHLSVLYLYCRRLTLLLMLPDVQYLFSKFTFLAVNDDIVTKQAPLEKSPFYIAQMDSTLLTVFVFTISLSL